MLADPHSSVAHHLGSLRLLDKGTAKSLSELIVKSIDAKVSPATPTGALKASEALDRLLERSVHARNIVNRIGRELRTDGKALVQEALALDFVLADIVAGLASALLSTLAGDASD